MVQTYEQIFSGEFVECEAVETAAGNVWRHERSEHNAQRWLVFVQYGSLNYLIKFL